jgi:NADH-quinone oxidoreductase subunit C
MFRRKNHSELLEDIKAHSEMNSFVIKHDISAEDLSIYISNSNIYDALKILRDDDIFLFSQLTDLCGVDWPENEIRFEVVYNLLSMSNNSRIRVKSLTDENNNIKSICKLFHCAEWYER